MSELTLDSLWGAFKTASDLYDRALEEGDKSMMRMWSAEMTRIVSIIEERNKNAGSD